MKSPCRELLASLASLASRWIVHLSIPVPILTPSSTYLQIHNSSSRSGPEPQVPQKMQMCWIPNRATHDQNLWFDVTKICAETIHSSPEVFCHIPWLDKKSLGDGKGSTCLKPPSQMTWFCRKLSDTPSRCFMFKKCHRIMTQIFRRMMAFGALGYPPFVWTKSAKASPLHAYGHIKNQSHEGTVFQQGCRPFWIRNTETSETVGTEETNKAWNPEESANLNYTSHLGVMIHSLLRYSLHLEDQPQQWGRN